MFCACVAPRVSGPTFTTRDVLPCYTGRGRSHKVGPAAKVGPCPFGVVNNGTGNISLLVLSNMPEGTDERYQNNSNAISKM